MIKWIKAKLFPGHNDERCTAHRFVCGKKVQEDPERKYFYLLLTAFIIATTIVLLFH